MVGKVIVLALRTALAWTFVHAGFLKMWDIGHGRPATPDFVVAIQQYHLLPSPDLAVLLAVYLPWVEVLAAVGLFLRRAQLGAATLISGLTVIFMAALGSAWSRGLRIECGCFGHDEVSTDFRALLLRDACILAAALFLLLRDQSRVRSNDRPMFGDSGRFTLP